MNYKGYTDSHKPLIRPIYIDIHKIWNKRPKTVSEDLTPRIMKILLGGNHNEKR